MKCTLILTLVTIGSLLSDVFAQYPVFEKDNYPSGCSLPDSALFAYLAKEDKVNDTTVYLGSDEQVIVGFKSIKYLGKVRKNLRYPRMYIYEVEVDTILWFDKELLFSSSQVFSSRYLVTKIRFDNYNVNIPTSVEFTTKYLLYKQTFDLKNKKRCLVNRMILMMGSGYYSKKTARFIEKSKKKLE